ncbi:MFS transporter [Iamia sp.]|uniref:MFS transporter n=1 Tax=Iamia sp. TaxID=2722710 RepID=UPI0032C22AF8
MGDRRSATPGVSPHPDRQGIALAVTPARSAASPIVIRLSSTEPPLTLPQGQGSTVVLVGCNRRHGERLLGESERDIASHTAGRRPARSRLRSLTVTQPSGLRRALARPGFRPLLAAQTISRWGDTFNSVALVILVYRLTGSGMKVAGTVAFEIAPVMLLGFVAGAVVDRYSRRRVMVAADLGRAAVAILLVASHDQLAVVYLAAFALSAFSVFFNPAAASVLPTLVPDDEVVGANSAIWSAAVISQIALAPVAAALVAIAGPGPAFAINSSAVRILPKASSSMASSTSRTSRWPISAANHLAWSLR